MKAIPTLASLVGLKVKHGSPGHEEHDVIKDVTFVKRVKVFFESGFVTNMTEADFDIFMEEGEVHYTQHFASEYDTGLAVLKLA